MPAAASAMHFGARREETFVNAGANRVGDRLKETGPAGAGIKLRFRVKQG